MEEKKKFILAVPTIIIIIIAIIGISLIYYNRNVKAMSREDALSLAKKVATIENISCEIVTETDENEIAQSVTNYKLKGNKMVSQTDYYTIYDNEDEKTKIQIDDTEMVAYIYTDYSSEIVSFQEMIYAAEKLLESGDYEYTFNSYETMNGTKCIAFTLSNTDTTYNIWLDRSSGMIVKMECHYHMEGTEEINTTMYYRYQIGNVTDEEVANPDLSEYSVIDL